MNDVFDCVICFLNDLLTYLLTSWSRIVLEKPTSFQLIKKLTKCYGTRMFIAAFTSARHLSLSWASSIQYIYQNPTSWRSILILSSNLCLGLTRGLVPSGFPTKPPYTPLHSHLRTTCPAHPVLLDFITRGVRSTDHWAPHYIIFSTPLLPHPS